MSQDAVDRELAGMTAVQARAAREANPHRDSKIYISNHPCKRCGQSDYYISNQKCCHCARVASREQARERDLQFRLRMARGEVVTALEYVEALQLRCER